MAAGNVISVVGEINYLNLGYAIGGIKGENTRKEKLFIIGVGRENKQVANGIVVFPILNLCVIGLFIKYFNFGNFRLFFKGQSYLRTKKLTILLQNALMNTQNLWHITDVL